MILNIRIAFITYVEGKKKNLILHYTIFDIIERHYGKNVCVKIQISKHKKSIK